MTITVPNRSWAWCEEWLSLADLWWWEFGVRMLRRPGEGPAWFEVERA